MSRRDNSEEAPQRSAAKEKLVATAAEWGATAAWQVIPRVQAAATKDEVSALLNELAGAIVSKARTRFSDDPALAEVWRVAAHEAACAQPSAVEWHGPWSRSRELWRRPHLANWGERSPACRL